MLPYKTSKDYKRLKELLDEGKEIVHFYDVKIGSDISIRRCDLSLCSDKCYYIAGITYYRWEQDKIPFNILCEKYNIEFIEPNL